ncbi:hypothetical protein [Sphingomonas arenae]|uniref:hypothetical protein n=1 Tax=Sphingomonas arenae TaxID=2812555 RepID=UPI001966D4AD|nr:hypothetical protein [Sphingomonas arenae]
MAGTNNDLPEGTDTVIEGAGVTSDITPGRSGTSLQGGSTSSQGNATGARTGVTGSASADTSTGLITGTDTGTTSGATQGSSSDAGSSSGGGGGGGGVRGLLSNASGKVREQAGTKARSFVGQGLETGGTTLTNLSQIVNDTVGQIEEKLGPQYGEYARTASQTLDRYAQALSSKDPDELVDDVRSFVRKSPGVALGAAAVVGFSLVRLLKAGIEENGNGNGDRNGDRAGSGR